MTKERQAVIERVEDMLHALTATRSPQRDLVELLEAVLEELKRDPRSA